MPSPTKRTRSTARAGKGGCTTGKGGVVARREEGEVEIDRMPPTRSAARSAPVSTATTPGARAPTGVERADSGMGMRRAQDDGVAFAGR